MAWSNPVFAKDAKVHLISETPDQPNSDPYPYITMAGLQDFKSPVVGTMTTWESTGSQHDLCSQEIHDASTCAASGRRNYQ